MSEPPELTAAELEELSLDLQTLQANLTAQVEGLKADSVPVDLETPIGRLSRMDAMQQQQMASANARLAAQRLTLVRRAIDSLRDETYGECRNCEEPIGYRRLKARPESPRCLRCQTARES